MLYFGTYNTAAVMFGDMIPYGHLEETFGLLFLLFQKFFAHYIFAESENFSASKHAS
jgi:hypothetical protein